MPPAKALFLIRFLGFTRFSDPELGKIVLIWGYCQALTFSLFQSIGRNKQMPKQLQPFANGCRSLSES
ncbi:MAG: hypothetical protein DYG99_16350 [Bacteroidetes bacterium CHB5]|nr:hypothetical protein [Bacteroidetes bacterium CHB5]